MRKIIDLINRAPRWSRPLIGIAAIPLIVVSLPFQLAHYLGGEAYRDLFDSYNEPNL